MFCSPGNRPRLSRIPRSGLALIAAAILCCGCSGGKPARPAVVRLGVLRFENLGADPSADWIGRAIAEVVQNSLSQLPAAYVVPADRLHSVEAAWGARPVAAPGSSAERPAALACGANSLLYGAYTSDAGGLSVSVTREDAASGALATWSLRVPAGDALGAGLAIARRIDSQAAPYATSDPAILRAYAAAFETPGDAEALNRLRQAMASGPPFGPGVRLLAATEVHLPGGAPAAAATLRGALDKGGLSPAESARTRLQLSLLERDLAARDRAFADLLQATPADPTLWRSAGELAAAARQYPRAVGAYRRALAIEPEDINTWNQLGYAAAWNGNLPLAMESLRRYQALRPADPNAVDSMGDVNFLLGRFREASGFYQDAAKKDPAFQGGIDLLKAALSQLASGDTAAAGALAGQYAEARSKAGDPLVPVYRAEWSWLAGRRREALSQMKAAAAGAARDAALRAYTEMAVWNLVLGDRDAAVAASAQATAIAGPSGAPGVAVVRFLSQPSAPPAEWFARAARQFPDASAGPLRENALAYALLLDSHFAEAAPLLSRLQASQGPNGDPALPVMLGWCLLQSGKPVEAAEQLKFNPVMPTGGAGMAVSLWFPRLFFLRAQLAAAAGKPEDARKLNRLFLQLSGPDPLRWGEEQKAKATL